MHVFFQQNKKERIIPTTWRAEPYDSQLGQVFYYLVALQLRAICLLTYPPPVMGLFMADGNVTAFYSLCLYITNIYVYTVVFLFLVLHSGGLD